MRCPGIAWNWRWAAALWWAYHGWAYHGWAYHAPSRRSFSQRLRSLGGWAAGRLGGWAAGRLGGWAAAHLSGVVQEKTLDVCAKRAVWAAAFAHPEAAHPEAAHPEAAHPEAHRTSSMLDRLMRGMNRYFVSGQRLHGRREASRQHVRSWALLWNFAPWSPQASRANGPWHSPAERLNQHRDHDNWLQNLYISASCGGYRGPHKE